MLLAICADRLWVGLWRAVSTCQGVLAEQVGDELDDLINDIDDLAVATITDAKRRVGVELCRGNTRLILS